MQMLFAITAFSIGLAAVAADAQVAAVEPTDQELVTETEAGEQALQGLAWPRGMRFRIGVPSLPDTANAPPRIGTNEGQSDSKDQPPAPLDSTNSPGASSAQGAVKQLPDEMKVHLRRASALSNAALELRTSGMDLAKLSVAKRTRETVLPILLFLVEKKVLDRDEMARILATLDVEELLYRLAKLALRLEQDGDRHRVLLFIHQSRHGDASGDLPK